MYDDINYWSEFEYSKLKLLQHNEKIKALLDVYEKKLDYDFFPPISVEIHLTDLCNLACPWCTDKELHKNASTLSFEKVCELMDFFGENGTGVTLEGGGEPTLHPDFKRIVSYGSNHSVDMGLITNGTVDISDVINNFKWVRVSLDASNKEEYLREKGFNLFDRVVSNIEKMSATRDNRKCFLGIGYVITTRNISNIEHIVECMDNLKVDYLYFRPVEEFGEITPSREELYDLRIRLLNLTEKMRIRFILSINDRLEDGNVGLPCVAHSITSVIHANGDVFCCEKRRHDEICYGNVNQIRFEDVWKSEKRIETTRKLLNPDCQKECSVCRITSFNKIVNDLERINTTRFI